LPLKFFSILVLLLRLWMGL